MSDRKGNHQHSEVREYANNKTGFNQFTKWVRKCVLKGHPCRYVMEATGIYHEKLAYHLWKLNFDVVVVLPSRSKKYAEYNAFRTKTDKVDSIMLSELGCSDTRLNLWSPPTPVYRKLKQFTGLSAVEYIRSIRLKKAALLLQSGNFTVSEVMYSVGFSNASYFTRTFSTASASPSETTKCERIVSWQKNRVFSVPPLKG